MALVFSMCLFALIGAISPGPVNLIATSTAANFGLRRALPHVFGATLAYTLVVLVVGLGVNQLLQLLPQITTVLRYSGAGFLLYMAAKIALATPVAMETHAHRNAPSLWQGALAQGLNPKAWLVSLSGVTLFVSPQSPALSYLLLFCAISFVLCLLGVGCWALLGQAIRPWLTNPSRQRFFNRSMGLLLAASVAIIWFD